ncbi:HAMP domain-containing sensor histidine kinase [Hymenobacter sp. BT770]|uniref:sensor histidine kinase n=1 Tax=Hymenobacter sp. BT770 TaxID=2886942 RepID=UPI001D10C461|nr:HAMP domain-containing sensor histidine kinase [Hymenobacter sp. BT770]MCC3153937.1 HAMP domain-containing histidine kinase [Hymenobacter sp. BT770]MDO3416133.1 HAMP domain-containing sensor histidine kinase [Hymenobacter sp. BT770]
MKRRIRSIFWLMVVCMLGINGFQAYWLYNTYQLTASQFARTAREALESVVQGQQLNMARQFVDREQGTKGRIVVFQNITGDGQLDRVVVRQHAASDGSQQGFFYKRETTERRDTLAQAGPATKTRIQVQQPGQPARISGPATTMVRKISKILADNFAGGKPVDLRQLAADYHRALRLRGADAALVLDTLSIPIRQPNAGSVLQKKAPARRGFSLQTSPVSLNPFRELYVQASFQPPTFYVLRQMGGLLAGSVLLLALTTGCFWLMLSTILKQKKLSDVKNDFINNMTHELKTPLATVSAAVEALQNFGALNDPAKTQAYLSISRTELQRLSDLVEKVLNIAVDERQQLELMPEPVQPAELVAEIVARHQLQAAKPVKFDVEVAPAAPVQFDRLHMGNVINNLIDNAIKYSRDDVTITIRGRQEASGWHLTVADNGPGIESGYQEAIFDRFFRVPTGNLHNVKGFGLGLYYVRQVVERHGGRIGVRSGVGQGSEFALWIPQG